MRKLTYFAATLTLSLLSLGGPAFATNQSEAVELCKKAQNCSTFKHGSGIGIFGKNSGGRYDIYCPDEGECVCLSCPPPARTAGSDIVGGMFFATPRPQAAPVSLSEPNDTPSEQAGSGDTGGSSGDTGGSSGDIGQWQGTTDQPPIL